MEFHRPRGTRDFLPDEMAKRKYVENRLREVAIRWGYGEIKTPTFEHIELFTIKSGEGILGEIYNFKDKGGREITLRPELTAPVVRMYIEELQRSPKPLKFYYFDNCFRYERPQKGRFREFFQFGIEIIGSARPESDAEVIALSVEMLNSVGVRGDLHVGHLGIVRALLKDIPPGHQSKIMRLVDKKDDKGLEDFLDEIRAPDEIKGKLFRLIGLRGINAMPEARELVGNIEVISQFETLLSLLDVYGLEYQVDLGIARGLDYYTGMVFEIYCEGLGAQNQVCGGGSYRLAQLFGGEDTPSTGYAIGFDRIMEICEVKPAEAKRIVVVSFEDTRKEAIVIAKRLREHVATYVDVMGRKFKDQMSYANTIGASHVVIVGRNELEAGKVALKDMKTGEQVLLTVEEVAGKM
ncbi:histidyl-tRNA synthetase [Candidatus Methanoperedens nitroreducens]|uniref:Histidine--tRNA ligase n=1 Tax=Candidatus Methanoperedens nitratireducens TaxID=1392998 RepID=A0A062V9U3_9EURY|nr:histidine--tRNA ligase [Candidatus Methanoperedens nitroreducens]KCZ72120.1 histidyl-tRNA synthetase [Candidatus Methanoperedens nitroreducens]MDJ1421903.1 histidine--tRNA ligase [Candidatus Methanoperedens sp.]